MEMWPVNFSVVAPLQPNQIPKYSLSAAASDMARPPAVPALLSAGALTRLETTINRLMAPTPATRREPLPHRATDGLLPYAAPHRPGCQIRRSPLLRRRLPHR